MCGGYHVCGMGRKRKAGRGGVVWGASARQAGAGRWLEGSAHFRAALAAAAALALQAQAEPLVYEAWALFSTTPSNLQGSTNRGTEIQKVEKRNRSSDKWNTEGQTARLCPTAEHSQAAALTSAGTT
jgi:hypothetical protein